MYCPKCGAENSQGAVSCSGCQGVFVYATRQISAPAIASMVMGIVGCTRLGFFGIPSLAGLILGVLALRQMKKSGWSLEGAGFAIAGIFTSATVLLLAGVMFVVRVLPEIARCIAG